jgi:hypothetical protein
MLHFRLPAFVLIVAALQMTALAAADPVRDGLEKAKTTRTEERARAKTTLVASIDVFIKAAAGAGDLEGLKVLTAQKDALVTAGVLPNLAVLKDPVAQYTQALRKADGELVAAYETAIQSYANAQKNTEADALRRERQQLLNGGAAPADSPEAFALILDRAKADYQSTINDARKVYVQTIVARVEVATRNGDLAAVTRFKAAQSAAEADQPLAADMNDGTVLGARMKFNNAIQSANLRLAQAYREAIRGLTRANKIDQATATQAEFNATGLTGVTAGANAANATNNNAVGDFSTNLGRTLPPFLGASGAFGVDKDGGIVPVPGCTISTHGSDYFTKDFIFELTFNVPKENKSIFVGIGDFSDKASLRVGIYDDGGAGRHAHLAIGEEWGKKMGRIHVGEDIVVRLERHDGPITASIGAYVQGKFVPEMSQTVADPKKQMPEMSERRGKLFFHGTTRYLRVRIATGGAAKPDAVADPAGAIGGPMGVVKFGNNGNPAGNAAGPVVAKPAVNDAAKGLYTLASSKLPPGFTATGTFTATTEGLVPAEGCKIVSTADDYFSKDFRFDVSLQVPPKAGWLEVGIGDTTQEGSFRFSIRQDHGKTPFAALCQGDEWGKEVGKIRGVNQPYVLRIEHIGQSLTFSAGQMRNGVFDAEVTQTVSDPHKAVKAFSDRRAKLFFGGPTEWTSLQLLTGAAVAAAKPVPATPAVVPVIPKPPVTPPAVVVTPPAVAPNTQKTTQPAATAGIETRTPAAASQVPAKIPAEDLIAVGSLETKKLPTLHAVPGIVTFNIPVAAKAWTGGNGVALSAGKSWERVGTIWFCNNLACRPNGAAFIHPLADGQIAIAVYQSGIGYRNEGTWSVKKGAYSPLPLTEEGKTVFPLRGDKHTVRSEMAPDGTSKVYVDGVLAATAKFRTAKPLDLGNGLVAANVPPKLARGQAAVIVDHGDKANAVAGDVSLFPAK